ncbi:MAG TPA: DUF5753 domain-containing protein [Streptosporangiaceae bacterium]
MSTEPIDPTSSARAFYAVQLRRVRTAAKLTQSQLGGHPDMVVSGKLIEAVENLRRAPTRRLSVGLDKAFGLDQFFAGMYAAIKRESGIPSHFLEYIEYEERASSIKIYANFLVSGLLQTEEYAREVLSPIQRPDRLEQLVAARLARQEILRRDDPPWLDVLLDESVVRRIVGDREITRRQLERLLEAAHESHVTIRVVPAGAPAYPSGAFILLGFAEEPAIGYVEGVNGLGQLIEPGREVSALGVTFDQIGAVAMTPADTEELIRVVLESM